MKLSNVSPKAARVLGRILDGVERGIDRASGLVAKAFSSPAARTCAIVAVGAMVLVVGHSHAWATTWAPTTGTITPNDQPTNVGYLTDQVFPAIGPSIGAGAVPYSAKWLIHTARGFM